MTHTLFYRLRAFWIDNEPFLTSIVILCIIGILLLCYFYSLAVTHSIADGFIAASIP